MTEWEWDGLEPAAYSVILADPATSFETHTDAGQGKSASQHYDVMSIDDICALPVWKLADPKGCLLVMWSTWALSAVGEHIKIMSSWGFSPSSGGVWAKITRNALPCFGTGYILRDSCEPFWTATRKRAPAGMRKTERNIIFAERREHSQKPDEMCEMIERILPGARKCELFSRGDRPGWDHWGKEKGKFHSSLTGGLHAV